MGSGICARLVDAGFEVTATDKCSALQTGVRTLGASWAPSIEAAAQDAQWLVTSLPGADEVRSVIAEVVGSLRSGACWVEMSSAAPRVGQQIAAATRPRGVRTIDAPVGGGPMQAREGGLLVFAGGTDRDVLGARPVLDALAERVVHVGPSGSGYAVKLLVNALWFAHAVASAEVLALGRRVGLDLDLLLGVLNESAATSRFLERDASALLDGDDKATFSLARCCEELASVCAIADELGLSLDVLSTVARLHFDALERYGDVDGELLAARLVAERAGVDLRRGPGDR